MNFKKWAISTLLTASAAASQADSTVYAAGALGADGKFVDVSNAMYVLHTKKKCTLPISDRKSMRAAEFPIMNINVQGAEIALERDNKSSASVKHLDRMKRKTFGCWGITLDGDALIVDATGYAKIEPAGIFAELSESDDLGLLTMVKPPYSQNIELKIQ
ncbi:hypothetical protein [Chitiniphilus shinanonensis]|uniref:hypothetical protein n=1 Tax=Chitiniphilus shinanonensis TaxID=553088 RepID=UPI003042FE2B